MIPISLLIVTTAGALRNAGHQSIENIVVTAAFTNEYRHHREVAGTVFVDQMDFHTQPFTMQCVFTRRMEVELLEVVPVRTETDIATGLVFYFHSMAIVDHRDLIRPVME